LFMVIVPTAESPTKTNLYSAATTGIINRIIILFKSLDYFLLQSNHSVIFVENIHLPTNLVFIYLY
jgi:hypothetical protein